MSRQAKKILLIGNKEKAVLHIAKAQLGMSDAAYRDMLASVGCRSSVELDYPKYELVMDRLRTAGFKHVHGSAKRSGMHLAPSSGKTPMISKIAAILSDLELSWAYADGIAMQMFEIQRLRWCNGEQTYKVLQALVVYQKRKSTVEGRTIREK
ncbi:MAG: regulatory protein GemA [Syntrophobacteraceae bacterium]|jgi:phage gp16-like protein